MLSCSSRCAAARCSVSRPIGAGRVSVSRPAVQLWSRRSVSTSAASAAAAAATQLALHVGETTIQVPFAAEQAKTLDAALAKLLQTFADKQEAKRPRRWDMMEVRFAGGDAGPGLEVFEVFCNPNAHATAFDAKLLITIKAEGGLKVVCEGRLSAIKADLDMFMQNL